MDAFIALNKYIVKETVKAGVGVPVSIDENIAKSETCRRKGVASKNRWMLINIPERDSYLDMMLPMDKQSKPIIEALMDNKFLCTLFVDEAHKFLDSITPNIKGGGLDVKCKALLKEKYDFLMSMKSGQELIDFMDKRCISGDRAKVSALLWTTGIHGATYQDDKGERFLIFNAQDDIYPISMREGIVPDTLLIP